MRRDQLRQLVQGLLSDYRVSERRACRIVLLPRTVWQYKRKGRKNDQALRARIREIAHTRVRYGMWRIYTLLRREGWRDNHKRVYRLYKLEGLNLRSLRPPIGSHGARFLIYMNAGAWTLWPISSSMDENSAP